LASNDQRNDAAGKDWRAPPRIWLADCLETLALQEVYLEVYAENQRAITSIGIGFELVEQLDNIHKMSIDSRRFVEKINRSV
jgi:hypothetical protein